MRLLRRVAAAALLLLSTHVAQAAQLRLLTMNVAMLPFIHPHLNQRLKALGDELASRRYDLVGMQEAWRDKDAAYLASRAGLDHYERFPRDVAIGTGLAFLSRWPLEHKEQKVFTCRPSALRFAQGEWPANKGVLYAQVQTPQGPLDVYDTHLISDYSDARYYTLRLTQLFELAEEIRMRSGDRPFILMGDFNTAPLEAEYAVLRDLLDLDDACLKGKEDLCGATLDDGRRVDHVFVPRGGLKFVRAERVLKAQPGELALSDHAAVEATVDLELLALKPKRDAARRAAALRTVGRALDAMSAAMSQRQERRSWIPVYGFMMALRYSHQLDQLRDLRARVETALLTDLQAAR